MNMKMTNYKRIDYTEFIRRCKEIDNYDYFIFFKETYKNITTKMKMKCCICDDIFWRKPSNHLYLKQKCGKCCGTKKYTTETFIKKANQIHNSSYTYDKVQYINNKSKVIITCPVHGDFEQRPDDHLKGRGCDVCGGTHGGSTSSFIEKANTIHGNLYSYDKVNYIKNNLKVIITCPLHGDFEQKPNGHLLGYGCPKCLYKNETLTGEYIKEITGIDAKKKTIILNRGIVKKAIVDFYFEWMGYTIIVEYNGEQHYTAKIWNGKGEYFINSPKRFEKQKLRDKFLREWCEERNIVLIEIDGRNYYKEKLKNYLEKKLNDIKIKPRL